MDPRLGRTALGLAALLSAAAVRAASPVVGSTAPAVTATARPAASAPPHAVDALRTLVTTPLHEDLDGLLRRGVIRVAVTASKTHFFIDRGQQHGFAFESLREFEAFLRQRHRRARGSRPLTITFLPVPRTSCSSGSGTAGPTWPSPT